MTTLLRLSLRYLAHHRLQSLLLLVGIALGVAVVVAIDIANESARRSFRLTATSLSGRATHQIVGGGDGIDDAVYRHLRLDLGLRDCAPVLEDYVSVPTFDGRMMRLLGVDPFAEGRFRNYLGGEGEGTPTGDLSAFVTRPGGVLMAAGLARRFHLKSGDTLDITRGSRHFALLIVGLLEPTDELTAKALDGLLVADIATAQEIFGQPHRIGHIDLRADPDSLPRIEAGLPAGCRVVSVASRTAALEQLTESFELNLSAVSLLTIVVGMFLVYNTVTFFVVQRRGLFGVLRALGVTRGQIYALVLIETLILGLIGTLAGLALGVVLGQLAVRMVTRTINDLYFVLTVTDHSVAVWSLLKGALVGMFAALASAVVPAFEAAGVAPAGVMRRSVLESRVRGGVPLLTGAGVAMMVACVVLLAIPSRRVDVAFAALTFGVLGAALLVPLATIGLMTLLTPLSGGLGGAPARMAPRSVVRSLSRTAVAIAALMVAVSIIVGIDVMVSSFRQTVSDWLGVTLQADVYVSTPSGTASRFDTFDAGVASEIAAMPEVASAKGARTVRLESAYGLIFLTAVEGDLSFNRRLLWGVDDVPAALRAGAVLVSQPFAWRTQIGRGQSITLPTDDGPRAFPVAGVYYDYGTERGTVAMNADVYHQSWRDRQLSAVAVMLRPGVDAESFADVLRSRLAGSRGNSKDKVQSSDTNLRIVDMWENSKNRVQTSDTKFGLDVISNRALRTTALHIFDRTFAITNALRVLVTFVAFIGVLGTLMALQFERQREIGVLRATGMTVGQVARMIVVETGLMGFAAGLFALPLGAGLAWALVFVINPRSFGWTFAFLPAPMQFVTALATAVAAGLLAGLYPAWRFGRIAPAAALRSE